MTINPVTITMAEHELEAVLAAAHRQLNRLTPNSPAFNRLEKAMLTMSDELAAAAFARKAKWHPTTIEDLEGKF